MDAGKKTINEIFNGSRILEIPFFQRAYVWDEPQWERLLDDIENAYTIFYGFRNFETATYKYRKFCWRYKNGY